MQQIRHDGHRSIVDRSYDDWPQMDTDTSEAVQ